MRSRGFAVGIGVLSLGLIFISAGCGGGSGQTQFRVVQATPDESSVNVLVDGANVASGVNYGAATSYLTISSGTRHIQIEPTNSSTPVVDQNDSFTKSTNSTMVVANRSPNITGILFADNTTAPASGDFSVRIINAAPSLGTVDVYVVTSGTSISDVSPTISGLAFQAGSTYTSLTAGNYQIFFTIPGTKFVDATTGTITFTAGQNRSIVILNASGGGFTTLTLADLG
jgi:hypothetical protein